MPVPTFDDPAPYRSHIPRQSVLNWLTLVTFAALVVVQVVYWPLLGFLVPSITIALATPLLAFGPAGAITRALRKRELSTWSAAHGFAVLDKPDWPIPALPIAPFTIARARRKKVRTGMTGQVGAFPAWYIFYTWVNNNWVQFSTHYRNVYALRLPKALPPLTIGPTISTEAGSSVPFESIDFNKYWWVTCSDPAFAKAVITPVTMDRLLALGVPVTATTRIAIVGNELVAISISGTRGADTTRMYSALRIVAEGISPYVWEEYGQ
ncbi:hypothetical protein GOEFS_132_00270 [Gordonia effusa NBRC 100432]|uniref:DUF3137 domain-containing protein n=1 Tax=Gordonia effusa NBRC 100432 TaxID=1077974 RepID=H0R6U5_9ACTN|nr:hypothetical protein [Gordonia effusa]GAB20796.1 hypothetical protein GOEFS_132_00270 [Gordonia effusa NBRC 100432]